jgi:hypothetical protein
MKMMLETNRMRAVQKVENDKKRIRENLVKVAKLNVDTNELKNASYR